MISAAPASVGKPAPTACSAAWIVSVSIISIAPGTTPPETISETVSPASPVVAKNATIVLTVSGTGMTRSVIFVQIPSVPSEPTNAPSRS